MEQNHLFANCKGIMYLYCYFWIIPQEPHLYCFVNITSFSGHLPRYHWQIASIVSQIAVVFSEQSVK